MSLGEALQRANGEIMPLLELPGHGSGRNAFWDIPVLQRGRPRLASGTDIGRDRAVARIIYIIARAYQEEGSDKRR
jgi:hypothetical protein